MNLEDIKLFIEIKRRVGTLNYHQAIADYFLNSFGDSVTYNRQAILNFLSCLDFQLRSIEELEEQQYSLDKVKIDIENTPPQEEFRCFDIEEVLYCMKCSLIDLLAKDCKMMRESGRMFSDYAEIAFHNQNLFSIEEKADFYLQLGDALGF